MIFPEQCKSIGAVRRHGRRSDRQRDDGIYFASDYVLVFDAPDRCEIYHVESEGQGFIRRLKKVEKIAAAGQTLVCPDPVDITNRADLLRRAIALCQGGIDTVVFQGIDRHYMFVQRPAPEALTTVAVYDVAPPEPAWLEYNVRRLEAAGMFGDLMFTFEYHTLDLRQYEDPEKTTIFPCYASGLKGLFLDSLDGEPQGDIRLVGCNTSRNVLEARYPGKRFAHVNICPLSTRKPQRPFILRCCQSDLLGLKEIGGVPGVVVHWGASPRDIYEALRKLAATVRPPA